METSVLRKRLTDTIDAAKRTAAARRTRAEDASRAYAQFLDLVAVPLFRQVANILIDVMVTAESDRTYERMRPRAVK